MLTHRVSSAKAAGRFQARFLLFQILFEARWGGLVDWFGFSSLFFPQDLSVAVYVRQFISQHSQTHTQARIKQLKSPISLNMPNIHNILLPELSKAAGYYLELTCGSWLCENIFSAATWYIHCFLGFWLFFFNIYLYNSAVRQPWICKISLS